MNRLERLRQHSLVVADTGDVESIRQWRPVDATTNPSLLYKAAQDPRYARLVAGAVASVPARADDRLAAIIDALSVAFGHEILRLVEGRVSTEVDARLSFDTEATLRRALGLIERYERAGVSRARVLIKIASTWEGIRAAERLEREGVHCNLTLLFSFAQAAACADAGATLISPFVGRILDWYLRHEGVAGYAPDDDPGVASVTRIYRHYKRNGYATQVMGASFRNTGQILALAGCDLLTISPDLLHELAAGDGEVPRRLDPAAPGGEPAVRLDEPSFRWALNDDAMATDKLAEGIRNFARDTERLESLVADPAFLERAAG